MRDFYSHFETAIIFFKGSNISLSDELRHTKYDTSYLAVVFTKFNEANLQRQGNEVKLI